jgi:hypothetical protein
MAQRAINTTTTIPSTAKSASRQDGSHHFFSGVVAGGAGAFAGDAGNAFGLPDAEPTVWVEGGPFMRLSLTRNNRAKGSVDRLRLFSSPISQTRMPRGPISTAVCRKIANWRTIAGERPWVTPYKGPCEAATIGHIEVH